MNNIGVIILFGSMVNEGHRRRRRDANINLYLERRFLRDRYNVFDLSTQKFLESFRVSKDIFKYLLALIRPHIDAGQRRTKIPLEVKLAAVLNFYATGSYQRSTGDVMFHSMDQSVISRCVAELSSILEDTICKLYIKFPDERTQAQYKERFFEKTSHPGVIGCIDGTHVNILAPRENEHIFVNRRGNHSMNVQLVCNYDLLILAVCAKFPGSAHDSAIWEMSKVKRSLKAAFDNDQRNTWLLGDAGYPLEPFLMTPYRNPNAAQTMYNLLHSKARNPIERCIGVLKNTFRYLLGERVLRYEPVKVVKIFNVCAAIYNICLVNKLQMIDLPRPNEGEDSSYEGDFEYDDIHDFESAVAIRNGLLNCF